MSENLQIRQLAREAWAEAFCIVRQLRSHLSEVEFLRRVARQNEDGYELYGAFRDSTLVGVLGMRPVATLARGEHLHIDDLVVTEGERGLGLGKALLEFAEHEAMRRGVSAVFLDSRSEVVSFYERLGYERHPSPLLRKRF